MSLYPDYHNIPSNDNSTVFHAWALLHINPISDSYHIMTYFHIKYSKMAIIPHLRYINLYHHCAHSVGVVHHRALLAFKICNVISHLLVLYTMDQINAITAFHRLYVCCTFRLVKLLFLLLFLLIQGKQQQYRIQLNVMNLPILVHCRFHKKM